MDTSPRDTETGSIQHAQETDNPKTVDSRDVEHLETDGLDDEEYTVTIKTWTVVTVSRPLWPDSDSITDTGG